MAKKVTGRTSEIDADAVGQGLPAAPTLEFVGLRPTPYQARMKAKFWAAVRDDPMVDPALLSGTEIATLVSEPAVTSWFRDPAFRQFFLNGDEWRHSVEWLHDLWIQKAFDVLVSPTTETKDFISLGRELTKMTGRAAPAPAAAEPGARAPQTPEQARAIVERMARSMGWLPPAPATHPAPDAPEAPPEDLKQ